MRVEGALVMSVWSESFKDREGKDVEFYRALLSVPGEAPLQLKVGKDDFEMARECEGLNGSALVELDCRPGNRQSVYFKGLE